MLWFLLFLIVATVIVGIKGMLKISFWFMTFFFMLMGLLAYST